MDVEHELFNFFNKFVFSSSFWPVKIGVSVISEDNRMHLNTKHSSIKEFKTYSLNITDNFPSNAWFKRSNYLLICTPFSKSKHLESNGNIFISLIWRINRYTKFREAAFNLNFTSLTNTSVIAFIHSVLVLPKTNFDSNKVAMNKIAFEATRHEKISKSILRKSLCRLELNVHISRRGH